MLDKYLKWFAAHERLAIVVLVLVVGAFAFNKWLDKSAVDAKVQAATAQQALVESKQANEKLAALVAQQSAQYEQDKVRWAQEVNLLFSAIASRDAASAKKIVEVKKPSTPIAVVKDLNDAYNGTLPILPNTVTADGQIQFPAPVIQEFTVTKIERDTAVADVKDQKDVIARQAEQMVQADNMIKSFGTRVDGLNNQIVLQGKKCEADIAVVKTQARKSKRNWFIAGFVSGIATRLLLKF